MEKLTAVTSQKIVTGLEKLITIVNGTAARYQNLRTEGDQAGEDWIAQHML